MRRKALALNLTLLLSTLAIIQVVYVTKANPIGNAPTPSIQIIYPPNIPNRYENSTFTLQIYVNMLTDSPKLSNISYSLDGGPILHIENFTVNSVTDLLDQTDYKFYVAKTTLENLSEGDHIIVAYAGDMSTSRAFAVNSHYAVTAINVLSPRNQTYSNPVSLMFTVNGEIEDAHYYLYKDYEPVLDGSFRGNMTFANLSVGDYMMNVFVTTEKGQGSAMTFFSISSNNYSEDSLLVVMSIITTVVVIFGLVLLVYFIKTK